MPFSPKRAGTVAYSLVMFVVVSVLSGVLIAGLFVPLAGVAGVSGKAAATELDNIPASLETPVPPTRSRVLMANGKTLAYFYAENRIYVSLNKIAPVMRQAQLAIEDHRFYEHGALDMRGTMRALVRNNAGDGNTQGGSSITQQYVKMVQVEACQGDQECIVKATTASGSDGYRRKIRELRYAIALEKRLSKDQILERYLNIAYYGDGAYGVEAAARHYYNKRASELNLPEATLLAGLVQNPDANNPVNNKRAALDRRDVVANRMAELKMITPAQLVAVKKLGFDVGKVKGRTRNGCVGATYAFPCDFVYRTLLKTPSLGKTVQERANVIKRGGLTIQTMIDPKTQDLAQKEVSKVVGPTDPLISTMNMIQPGTGLIVAMAQSRPVMGSNKKKGETYYNLSADPSMGGIQGYQAGSTFKAFTAAAALEKGIPLSKKFNAKARMDFTGKYFNSCEGREQVGGKFPVKNSTGTNGNMNMMKGTEMSVNTYFVQLEFQTGMCRVTKMAKKLGVKLGTPSLDLVEDYQHTPSFTLGTAEVSPLSMAEAYATFAARGVHCDPIILKKITTRTGKSLEVPSGNCKRVISEDVADGMNKLLGGVMTKGTGKRAMTYDGRPQAGKTGTINSNEAVWFAGYTPEIAGVAMISIDVTQKPFIKSAKAKRAGQFRRSGVLNYRVPSTGVSLEGSGSGDAGSKIWRPVMNRYLKGVPATNFKAPPTRIERGKIITVPSVFGLGLQEAKKKLRKEGFDIETRYVFSKRPAGSFIGFSPGAGARVPQFSTIYANYSKGKEPKKDKKDKKDDKKKADDKPEEDGG